MNFSHFQLAIFDAAKNTVDNLAISAVAGSGKSTTLEHTTHQLPQDLSLLVVAFNKDITTALTPRIKHPKASVMTLNAFGYRICRTFIDDLGEMDKDKTANILKTFFDMEDKQDRGYYYRFRNCIVRLVELFRANLVYPPVTEGQIRDMAEDYGLDLPSEKPAFFELVNNVYIKHLSFGSILDFRDQVFLPIYNNMQIPQYDIVLCDESQDFDRNQMELILAAGRRVIMVGDPRQAIYGFRGALADAMEQMVKKIKAVELPLSICYRCPKSVIREAQKHVPEIQYCDDAPEGRNERVKMQDFRKNAKAGDFVLCRTTAPLVSECLRMIREGKKAMVKGRQIGEQLAIVIDKIATGDTQPIESFYRVLRKYQMEQLERLTKAEKEMEIEALNDRVETIRALAEACSDVAGIKRKILEVFSDTVAGTVFMTVHKSKGLEATTVWILEPQLLPHPKAKTEAQAKQEINLLYVAITRCKFDRNNEGSLFWVESERKQ